MNYSVKAKVRDQNLYSEPKLAIEEALISKREQEKKLKKTSVSLSSIRIDVEQCAEKQEGNQ